MRLIVLEAVTAEGFRCFGEAITLEFSTEAGLRFLAGNNLVEPALGSNGAGKSSLWEAVCWCLHGVVQHGDELLRASDLATWESDKRPHVRTVWSVDGRQYVVERLGSPDHLTLDGQHVAQDAVDTLMGLSRARFMQSVIYGQAAKLFMDLSIPQRAELMDEVMNLGIWLELSSAAANRVNELTLELGTLNTKLSYDQGRIDSIIAQVAELEAAEKRWNAEHKRELEAAQLAYMQADYELREAERSTKSIQKELDEAPSLENIEAAVTKLQQEEARLQIGVEVSEVEFQHIMADLFFLRDHTTCPQCKQRISRAFAEDRTGKLEDKRDDAMATTERAKQQCQQVTKRLQQVTEQRREAAAAVREAREALAAAKADQAARQRALAEAKRRLDAIAASGRNPISAQIEKLVRQADAAAAEVARLEAEAAFLQVRIDRTTYWRTGFRQVRLFEVKRILAMLEIETAAAAAQLGVGRWQITFDTEKETKSGTTRPGIYVSATNPQRAGKYNCYSFGEAQRIKLAVSLGLGSLIQSKAGVYHALEVFDEPSQHLSEEGIQDLLECLNERAETTGKTIWFIDHRTATYPFGEVWQITKQQQSVTMDRVA